MITPPPNPCAAESRAVIREYNASLLANHAPRSLWPLDAPYAWHVTANDAGCELWIDDPNSIDAAPHDAPER